MTSSIIFCDLICFNSTISFALRFMARKRQRGHVGLDKREWSYLHFEGLDGPPSAHWFVEFILPKNWMPPNLELSKKNYYSLTTNDFEGIFSKLLYHYS